MKVRNNVECDTLDEIITLLGDPNRIGKDITWVAKNYSAKQLILDLRKVQESLNQGLPDEFVEASREAMIEIIFNGGTPYVSAKTGK